MTGKCDLMIMNCERLMKTKKTEIILYMQTLEVLIFTRRCMK